MIDLTGSCRRHRVALLDFVAGGVTGPATPAALEHLDRCDRCVSELESTSLAVAALRRIGSEAEAVEPSPDAWPRLRRRVSRRSPARLGFMSPVAGMAMSLAIVVVTVIGGPGLPGSDSETTGIGGFIGSDSLGPIEEAWLRDRVDPSRRAVATPPAPATAPATSRSAGFLGPDGRGTPEPAAPERRIPPATSL